MAMIGTPADHDPFIAATKKRRILHRLDGPFCLRDYLLMTQENKMLVVLFDVVFEIDWTTHFSCFYF
jgi:hypothetical protein